MGSEENTALLCTFPGQKFLAAHTERGLYIKMLLTRDLTLSMDPASSQSSDKNGMRSVKKSILIGIAVWKCHFEKECQVRLQNLF